MGLYDFFIRTFFRSRFGRIIESYFIAQQLKLILEMMEIAIENGEVTLESLGTEKFEVGERLLSWIDAYAKAPGNLRSCWVGEKKRLVCMSWRDADSSDDEREDEDDE